MMTPAQLRELADKLESRGIPWISYSAWIFPDTLEEMSELIKKLGPGEKSFNSGTLTFRPKAIPELSVYLTNACTKRVVGKIYVEEIVTPAHEEEIVEWDCPKSILGGEK